MSQGYRTHLQLVPVTRKPKRSNRALVCLVWSAFLAFWMLVLRTAGYF